MKENMDERLLDLLCDTAAGNLSEDEARELAELSSRTDVELDLQSLELAAAAVMLASTDYEELPAHLEARILGAAEQHFPPPVPSRTNEMPAPARRVEWAAPRRSWFDRFGWAVAAAACVALIGTVFYNQNRVNDLQDQIAELKRPSPTPKVLTAAEKRDELIREANDIVRATWTKGNVKGSEGVTGDVVWSDEKQMGYMTFRGLPPNDPNREAYQLWIFEQAELEAFPKDGGVFNVSESGEMVIPIEAKLKTTSPKAFAVTVEKPGGVVRSEREKIAALAPVKPSQT